MCLPIGEKTVGAEGGVLDLRGADMETGVYTLDGEWEFYYGARLTPQDFGSGARQAVTIGVPSAWEAEGYPRSGFATYRLTVYTDGDEPLTLFLPEIYTAYTLWANGEIVSRAGVVSDAPADSRPAYENVLLPVALSNGAVELVIQVGNYDFYESGLTGSLLLGERAQIFSYFLRTRGLYCMALGCILMAAFYHLSLYIFRRREKIYLFFSLMCFTCLLRFLVETNGIVNFIPRIAEWAHLTSFFFLMFFLHSMMIMLFTLYVFNRELLASHRYAAAAYVLLGGLLIAFLPPNTAYTFGVQVAASLPLAVFTVIMAARSPVLRENKWSRLYFAAMTLYTVVGFSSKLVLENVWFMTGLLTNMFMILAQSLVLSRDYVRAFEVVEETNANLERLVDDRTKDLQHVNNAMKEMIGNISHDLKTPMTTVILTLEKLSKPGWAPGGEEYRQSVGVAYDKSLDLQRITQNLLEVGRIESGRSLYAPEWIPLRILLPEVELKYGAFIESKGLSFEIAAAAVGDEHVEIYADPQRVWSVFDNIIYNAERHTKTGGVTISALVREETADIVITDTGEGIDPEHLPHIFERFYKASRARGGGDSGVGLYIVKSMMEGCGGSVSARSEAGKGASFILTFLRKPENLD